MQSPWQLPTKVIDPKVDTKVPPKVYVDTLDAKTYFTMAADLMKDNPPHITDWSQVGCRVPSPRPRRSARPRARGAGLRHAHVQL